MPLIRRCRRVKQKQAQRLKHYPPVPPTSFIERRRVSQLFKIRAGEGAGERVEVCPATFDLSRFAANLAHRCSVCLLMRYSDNLLLDPIFARPSTLRGIRCSTCWSICISMVFGRRPSTSTPRIHAVMYLMTPSTIPRALGNGAGFFQLRRATSSDDQLGPDLRLFTNGWNSATTFPAIRCSLAYCLRRRFPVRHARSLAGCSVFFFANVGNVSRSPTALCPRPWLRLT
ncbi:hypothetical protein IWZ00DRAFT_176602 [Phyllosticta capitalensis]|uniref:uncharacterized protein n=1 Tax=Phyllosticta capitalensis TaxID=121624 RepID=UPI003131081B